MGNTDFNFDMDNYIRKIRKKRTDPIDYDHGEAKGKTVSSTESIENFNDEEIVIESRENNKFKKFILSIFNRPQRYEDDEIEAIVEEEIDGKPVNMTVNDVEEFEEDIEELEEETEGFFQRILNWLGSKRRDEYEDEDYELDSENQDVDEPEILSDTKGAFKAINNWLNKLSPEEKKNFKNSMDFKVYKSFLEKYKLIKKN